MELRADLTLPYPRDVVFRVYRDKTPELLPYLPNVREIKVESRKEDGALVKMVNVWKGGGEIPAAARAFLSEAMLSWTDRATWDSEKRTCDWAVETHAFTEAVSCTGQNRFVDEGGKTRLEIRGTLTIDPKKVRGVPSLLAGKVSRMIEEFLCAKIQPNFEETKRGVEAYLKDHPAT
jgi:hypothetical protein